MAATAMTIRSNVAKIGEMPFLDLNILNVVLFTFNFLKVRVQLYISYEIQIHTRNKYRTSRVHVFLLLQLCFVENFDRLLYRQSGRFRCRFLV